MKIISIEEIISLTYSAGYLKTKKLDNKCGVAQYVCQKTKEPWHDGGTVFVEYMQELYSLKPNGKTVLQAGGIEAHLVKNFYKITDKKDFFYKEHLGQFGVFYY